MKTYPIKSDRRWTIALEFTGHQSGNPQFVVRFCGDWVDSRSTFGAASVRAVDEWLVRNGALVVEEIPQPERDSPGIQV